MSILLPLLLILFSDKIIFIKSPMGNIYLNFLNLSYNFFTNACKYEDNSNENMTFLIRISIS